MLHIWPIAAFEDFDCAAIRMIAESFQSGGSATGSLFGAFVGDQCDGVVQADGEDIVRILEVRIGLAVLNIGAEATDLQIDHLAGIGMKTQLVAVWIDRCGGVAICAELAGELALRMA